MIKKHTWIIGASTGIGEALAQSLAKKGEILCLSARNEEALNNVKNSLTGGGHKVIAFDALDKNAMGQAVLNINNDWPQIDRVIYMAGLYTPSKFGEIDLSEAEKIIAVNLTSVFYMVENILPLMKAQGTGQIVICGSVAGYSGLPNSQPYGATKAALINLTESLRAEVGGILDIKLINPGFVKTRLTDKNNFNMPARISAEEAGDIIASQLDTNRFEIHFPKRFTYVIKLISNLPYWLYFKVATKMK